MLAYPVINALKYIMPKETKLLKSSIIEASEICVKCGLCLPHCPTYQVSENEAESPRGRIVMAQKLAKGDIDFTEKLNMHLDNCLSCQACEAMCPAKVPFHEMMLKTKELQAEKTSKKIPFFVRQLQKKPTKALFWQCLLKLYITSGLHFIFKQLRIEKFLAIANYFNFIPRQFKVTRLKSIYKTKNAKAQVALFIGCVNALVDTRAILDAIRILNNLDYDVVVPAKQSCCGTLNLHMGDRGGYEVFKQRNRHAFENCDIEAILTFASGCHESVKKQLSSIPVKNLLAFLLEKDFQKTYTLKGQAKKILIHNPCTLVNQSKQTRLLETLFEKEDCEYQFVKSFGCCGAAGLNMWQNPEKSQKFAEPIVQQIRQLKPDFVVTANIGCQLHLQNCLKKSAYFCEVLHPIELFAEKNLKNP